MSIDIPLIPFPSPLLLMSCQANVDNPELFEGVGITGGSGSSLSDPCLLFNFSLDVTAEVMGTQVSREQHSSLCWPLGRFGERKV